MRREARDTFPHLESHCDGRDRAFAVSVCASVSVKKERKKEGRTEAWTKSFVESYIPMFYNEQRNDRLVDSRRKMLRDAPDEQEA